VINISQQLATEHTTDPSDVTSDW